MACGKYGKLFSAYLEGDLNVRKRRHFENHLAECRFCMTEFDRFRKVVALTGDLPVIQPSQNFDEILRDRLSNSGVPAGFRMSFGRSTVAIVGAICFVLALVIGGYLYKRPGGGLQSKDDRLETLVGTEITPTMRSLTDEAVLRKFVMPSVPITATARLESGDSNAAIPEHWQEPRSFVLPFVTDETAERSEMSINYIIKRVSSTGFSGEIGL